MGAPGRGRTETYAQQAYRQLSDSPTRADALRRIEDGERLQFASAADARAAWTPTTSEPLPGGAFSIYLVRRDDGMVTHVSYTALSLYRAIYGHIERRSPLLVDSSYVEVERVASGRLLQALELYRGLVSPDAPHDDIDRRCAWVDGDRTYPRQAYDAISPLPTDDGWDRRRADAYRRTGAASRERWRQIHAGERAPHRPRARNARQVHQEIAAAAGTTVAQVEYAFHPDVINAVKPPMVKVRASRERIYRAALDLGDRITPWQLPPRFEEFLRERFPRVLD